VLDDLGDHRDRMIDLAVGRGVAERQAERRSDLAVFTYVGSYRF